MAVKNSTILDQIWLSATNDYQQRIPRATQGEVSKVAKALFAPMNRNYYNEFVNALINRIGLTVVRQLDWKNPLAQFKREGLQMGSGIQEIANKLIKAHGYDIEDGDLFQVNRPESAVAYHTVNREDRYDLTVNEVELRKAFLTPTGLNDYITSLLNIPQTSDQYDEYQIMKQLFAEYDQNDGGFFKVQVDEVTDEATAKNLLAQIRAYTGRMGFLSALYNKAKIPVYASPSDMVLFTTPEVAAMIDVHALAGAFNVSYAEVQSRVVLVDEFPMPDVVAILASKDLYMSADYIFQMDSFYNAKTMSTNYYLHHWGIYSMSPFMPAVEFTTAEGTDPATVTMNPTGLTAEFRNAEGTKVTSGNPYQDKFYLVTDLTGSVTPDNDNVYVLPDSVTTEITAAKGDANVPLNSRTFIGRDGQLHVQKNLEATTVLTVTATSTYQNPSGETTARTANATFTITE